MSDASQAFSDLSQFEIDPAAVQLLGYGFCAKKQVVVLGRVDPQGHDPVTVGMARPSDVELLTSLQSFLHRPIQPVALDPWEIQRALDIGHGKVDPADDPGRLVLPTVDAPEYGGGHPAPRIAMQILSRALGLGARDIHLERGPQGVQVRVRVDGGLHPLATGLAPDNVGAVLGYLATIARLPEGEGPREGIVQATMGAAEGGRPVDLRLLLLPGPHGEDATLQVLHGAAQPRPLDALGFDPAQLAAVRARLDAGQGLVVIAAGADQGRTTLLYSLLATLDTARRKVMTVEPVVEVDLEAIPQRTPGPSQSLADLARACLPHAPDVLAIGRVAEPDTAAAMGEALRRGVLVLAVVDAPDAAGAIGALRRLGLPDTELADHLVVVISPRLLPRLCPHCRTPAEGDARAAALARAGRAAQSFVAHGCPECGGRGHLGRVGVHEVLTPTPSLLEHVADGATTPWIRQAAGTEDRVVEAALGLANAGEVDLATVAGLPGAAARFGG